VVKDYVFFRKNRHTMNIVQVPTGKRYSGKAHPENVVEIKIE